jgi:hypothetical protein
MLKFIIVLLLIYFFFKFSRLLLRWYIGKKLNDTAHQKVKPVNDKFKDADDAEYTDIIDPDKKKNKE